MLYVPGQNAGMIDQARSSLADVVCLDLEDNVPPESKAQARNLIAEAVREGGFRALELIVRINSSDRAEQARDLAMLADTGVRDVLVPKVSTLDDLAVVRKGLGAGPVRLWAMIETAKGLAASSQIASDEDVTALVIGASDLAADLRLPLADAEYGLHLHGAQVVTTARVSGCSAIEGITTNPSAPNPCGFDGRSTYPGQDIAAINAAFSPSPEEVRRADAALVRPYAYGDHLVMAKRTLLLAERALAREQALAAKEK
jgi:citrate lyase beta subunit